MTKFILTIALLSFSLLSCDKTNNNIDTNIPSDLIINYEIAGKSDINANGDGSGLISFNITAKNATNFKILIGQDLIESASGSFDYKCKNPGIFDYTVIVSAYNGPNFISDTKIVTVYVKPLLLWADEFDKQGSPDPQKWTFEIGNGSSGWGNNEKQYYTARTENAVVENGVLKIKTIKEDYQGFNYTSARLISRDFFSFKYGIIEFRAKLPYGKGTWPALWMLGSDIGTVGWPACGEIDVMEHVGNQLNKIYGTLHHPGHSGGNPDGGSTIIDKATEEFHIYKLDWSQEKIKFYVDDEMYYSFSNSSTVPFNNNFFIIMNCAMGGNFGGTIDPEFKSSTFEIDYVRVYQ